MAKDFRDQMIKRLRRRVTDLEIAASNANEFSIHRLRHRIGSLVRENNELFVENRKLRKDLTCKKYRSIDPAYIVAVCKAITGGHNE